MIVIQYHATAHPDAALIDSFILLLLLYGGEIHVSWSQVTCNRGTTTGTVYHTHEHNPQEKLGVPPPPSATQPAPPTQDNPQRAPRHNKGAGLR